MKSLQLPGVAHASAGGHILLVTSSNILGQSKHILGKRETSRVSVENWELESHARSGKMHLVIWGDIQCQSQHTWGTRKIPKSEETKPGTRFQVRTDTWGSSWRHSWSG